jgi:hypothetical protein
MALRPISRKEKLKTAQAHMIADIGIAVPLLNPLTNAVDIAPNPN